MIQKKLAQSMALILAGSAMASGAYAADTMYNTWNAGAPAGYDYAAYTADPSALPTFPTDGWTHTDGKTNSGAIQSWVGTTDGGRPFGYVGNAALNWAIQLNSATDSGTISSADAQARYGVAADIDTAQGAWVDEKPQGWRHAVDFGLIQTSVDTDVRLAVTNPTSPAASFGISVYEGMDTNTTNSWSHHGGWHVGYVKGDTSNTNLAKVTENNPIGTAGLTFLTFADGSNIGAYGDDYVVFHALAGRTYTVILGGSDGATGTWAKPQAQYSLDVAAVPVPGAVWLFGSALAGVMGLRRRKQAA